MTYRDLISNAQWKLDHNEITLGEYEEMTKPLNREVDVLDEIRAEIGKNKSEANNLLKEYGHDERVFGCICGYDEVLKIIDKYSGVSE